MDRVRLELYAQIRQLELVHRMQLYPYRVWQLVQVDGPDPEATWYR